MSVPDLAGVVGLVVLVVLVAGLVAVACWAGFLVADLRALPTPAPDASGHHPSVSVVVPARNEESSLPRLLRSLAGLSPPVAEVVVVDDESHDRTAQVARDGGARVVTAGTPPQGWTGKAWACHTGADRTTGELVLFLDADTELGAGALGALLEVWRRHGGLVSVQPFHGVVRPHEQLSAYFNLVAVMASSAFTGRPGRDSMAFGPCLLTSRADLASAGGHAGVRGAVLDDAALAQAYHRVGLPVWCAVGGDDVRMRSYPDGLAQLAAGWTKNIASGASSASRPASIGTALWVAAHHASTVGAAVALVDLLTGTPLAPHAWVWLAAYPAFACQVRSVLRRVGSFRWWTWALFPLPLIAFDVLFARSALLTLGRGSVRWRGRDVDVRGHGSTEEVA